jgi:sporulation protein YlmC with PRC-barrel domain
MHHHDAQHAAMGLASLDEMNDFKVAEGFPDPRGWDVKTADGRTIGKVKDLLVDKQAMRVKLLEVELRDEFASGRDDVRVHVPVASARLDDDHDDVIVDLATAGLGDFSSTAGTVDTLGTVGTATTRDASATTGLGAAAAGTAAMGAGGSPTTISTTIGASSAIASAGARTSSSSACTRSSSRWASARCSRARWSSTRRSTPSRCARRCP